ncbi:protein stum homolog [Pecten maximus]|uniref:protein stum homolog n=1 Tax=Pecten maximus TaxID=6579 RepID=UPI0014583E34|nr:protein stum homolog [Pecten maximus]
MQNGSLLPEGSTRTGSVLNERMQQNGGRSCQIHEETTPTHTMAMAALPKPVAVVCCVSNFAFPGLGTMMTGFAMCCCDRHGVRNRSDVCANCTANVVIGLLQILLTPIFLLGWLWSCMWGILFLRTADEYDNQHRQNDCMTSSSNDVDIIQQTIVNIEACALDPGQIHRTVNPYDADKHDPPPRYEILIQDSDEDDDLEPSPEDNEPPPPY